VVGASETAPVVFGGDSIAAISGMGSAEVEFINVEFSSDVSVSVTSVVFAILSGKQEGCIGSSSSDSDR
jgi:hypothetical protein